MGVAPSGMAPILVANFFEDLERSEFAKGFFRPDSPSGKKEEPDPDLIPSEIFTFPLNMNIKPPTND